MKHILLCGSICCSLKHVFSPRSFARLLFPGEGAVANSAVEVLPPEGAVLVDETARGSAALAEPLRHLLEVIPEGGKDVRHGIWCLISLAREGSCLRSTLDALPVEASVRLPPWHYGVRLTTVALWCTSDHRTMNGLGCECGSQASTRGREQRACHSKPQRITLRVPYLFMMTPAAAVLCPCASLVSFSSFDESNRVGMAG